MRSVKLTIAGNYWDSQIYAGELLLFDTAGAVHRIEWRDVIDEIAESNIAVQTAIRVAFSDSDLFYNPKVRKILRDPHIEGPIKLQLNSLADLSMAVTEQDWRDHWRTEDTPFDFLPTDTDVYYNHIFAGGDEGLFSAPRSGLGAGRSFANRTTKHHDSRIFQVRASDRFTAVAAAAGDDGLFEFAFRRSDDDVLNEQRQLAKRSCSACDWAFQSVMGWTARSAFLASFRQEKDPTTRRPTRTFDRIVEIAEMFDEPQQSGARGGFTWGSREKIYRISERGVEVANYLPDPPREKKGKGAAPTVPKLFAKRGSLELNFDATTAIATGTAPFGTVLEFDDRLVVLRSDGAVEEILGEAVHWRVFPRSEHYSNQLHVIYDDRLEIISFVHDYFVDQNVKLSGFKRGGNDFIAEDQR